MRTLPLLTLSLCFIFVPALQADVEPATSKTFGLDIDTATQTAEPNDSPCPLFTIAKGQLSGLGLEPGFHGAELIINHPEAWHAFWEVHTAVLEDPPPPPPINFEEHVVLARILGPQPNFGGPNTAILGLHPEGPFLNVRVFDDRRPGGSEEGPANPFHIVAVERGCLPPHAALSFAHIGPHPEAGVIEGRVWSVPEGEEEEPPHRLPYAHVILEPLNEELEPRHALSGGDGSYFFVNVPPGEYELIAEAEGHEPVVETVFVEPGGYFRQPLVLTALPPEPAAVLGLVLHPAEGWYAPLPDAVVHLIREGEVIAETFSNDEGFFLFDDVMPGPYLLRANHPDFAPQAVPIFAHPGEEVFQVFILEEGEPEEFGVFEGVVLGLVDGEAVPLADARVKVRRGDFMRLAWTNEDGFFEFPELPAGEYWTVARAPGFEHAGMEIEIFPNDVTEEEFILEPVGPPEQTPVDDLLAW